MEVLVTARHCNIDDELHDRAVDLIRKAAKLASRPQSAEIIFDDDHNRRIVELQLYLPRGRVHVSSAEAHDFRTALDGAIAKLRNQLDKLPSDVDKRSAAEGQ